jgi:hypothetical protein
MYPLHLVVFTSSYQSADDYYASTAGRMRRRRTRKPRRNAANAAPPA